VSGRQCPGPRGGRRGHPSGLARRGHLAHQLLEPSQQYVELVLESSEFLSEPRGFIGGRAGRAGNGVGSAFEGLLL